ncbi:MAG: response regulator [Polyangiaceae bacterium]|nr:response regulator [Polyangiaceae bacterium]
MVDDEQRNIDALEAILTESSYRLLTATDADRALRLLLENDVAVIVLDIKMPGVSGFELAKLIKGTKRFREIPILFLTAYMVEDQDVLAGYGAGAVDYLTKPLNPQILRQKVSVFAELFRKTRALAELNATLEARVLERTAELERSEAELRKSAQQKDAFLATLAHELRNPLVPLRTGVDYLKRQPGQPPASAKVVETMNRQLDHMVRLIDDLLDVARISRGVLELKCGQFVLADVVNEAILDLKSVPSQRSLEIECSLDDRVMVYADRTRIRQIVGNLLDNAVKYSQTGGTIRVELERGGDNVSVRVCDQGIGIAADKQDQVFDMFTRVQRPESMLTGGLGLGLAIARQLAEMHGGALGVTSRGEGLGSTFTLTLPALEGPAESGTTGESTPKAPTKEERLSVLLIEDNPDVADVLALWLKDQGHAVHVAGDGLQGIEMVKSASPALVLCDLGLPGIDGVEVCKRLKALELENAPYMVALTGWGMRSDRERTREAGFDQHLVKPVDMDKLSDLLRMVAAERAERARHAS